MEPEARDLYRRAEGADAGLWRVYEGRGDYLSDRCFWAALPDLKRELGAQALDQYRKAIDLNPAYMDLWVGISRVQAALGEPEQGLVALRQAVDQAPYNAEYQRELGQQLRALGRYPEALEAFTAARRLIGRSDEMIRLNIEWLHRRLAADRARSPEAGKSAENHE